MPKPNKAKVNKAILDALLKAAIEVESIREGCCTVIMYNTRWKEDSMLRFSKVFSPDGYKDHYSYYWPDFSPNSQRERVLALLFFREMLRTGDV